jgi:hypothetical protein
VRKARAASISPGFVGAACSSLGVHHVKHSDVEKGHRTYAQDIRRDKYRIANRLHEICKSTTKARWEFPPKPSRMRWRTYMRLRRQYDELRGRWTAGEGEPCR